MQRDSRELYTYGRIVNEDSDETAKKCRHVRTFADDIYTLWMLMNNLNQMVDL